MVFWPVTSEQAILVGMSEKPNISNVADAFFHLWQKQVSLMAQSPDKVIKPLQAEGRQIQQNTPTDNSESGKKSSS